ncbi:glutathione S-transferase [Sphingomonas sp. SUN019]|uniref:glutathione S-transferase n=1 Tax=Sphingomonas sp. SUN019 TaxID=2937788 RepID=UPI0021640C29|nr:glutathione S-transferase [Sphingomonas sp. SUN019]UVO51139.1 glutathione S-transferase [Sphingomonas sp. SUN019]
MTTLYSFRRCPYAMRARMALLVSATAFEVCEVALRDKPADMIAASPKATVPVLVLSDGQVIDESLDIMRWALARNDPEDWLAGDEDALIDTFDTRFKHHLDRYKYAERHDADPAEHRAACFALLQLLEDRLTAAENLSRATRSLGDIAIMPFVRQFAAVDHTWFDGQPIPRTKCWLARHIASPLFERAMARVPRWVPGDAAPG